MAKDVVLDGVFSVNKPIGMSSAQVIRECQEQFNPSAMFAPMLQREVSFRAQESKTAQKRRGRAKRDIRVKMGHGGTLDPLATGVLILGLGSATKVLGTFLNCTKEYETVVLFGASTDTYDRVGRILTKRPYEDITRKKVEDALERFRGPIKQIPPIFSALKQDGKKLYEYAREGKQPPRDIMPRDVEVTELELVEWYEPGSHNHRWPTEEAEAFERNFAEQLWRNQKNSANAKELTDEQKQEEEKAIEEHESFKKDFEERQDSLIRDDPRKRHRVVKEPPLMSGALGPMPKKAKAAFANLVPSPSPADTPPPWSDKGPPAAKIRMKVSSGFYVRSFCHDLGMSLGSAAMMAELVRQRQGDFTLGGPNCLEWEDLKAGEDAWAPKVREMLQRWTADKAPKSMSVAAAAKIDRELKRSPRHERVDKRRADADEEGGESQPPPVKKRRNSSSDEEGARTAPSPMVVEKTGADAEEDVEMAGEAKSDLVDSRSEASWNGIKD